MKRLAWLAIPLLAAACGEQRPAQAPESDEIAAAPLPADTAATGIPDALGGRWGLVPADCTSTRGDAKGLIVVSPGEIRFYESRAALTDTAARTPRSVSGTFSFTGEGTTWSREMTLDLSDDGKTLTRSEFGEDAAAPPLRYTRCETEMPPTP